MSDHYPTPCEVVTRWRAEGGIAEQCGRPSVYRYAAMSGGYMHLCGQHGQQHAAYAEHVTRGAGWMLREQPASVAPPRTRTWTKANRVKPETRTRGRKIRERREALRMERSELGRRALLATSTMRAVEMGHYWGPAALDRVERALAEAERAAPPTSSVSEG
jgi:DNA-binding XRE family transcriptional regulator